MNESFDEKCLSSYGNRRLLIGMLAQFETIMISYETLDETHVKFSQDKQQET